MPPSQQQSPSSNGVEPSAQTQEESVRSSKERALTAVLANDVPAIEQLLIEQTQLDALDWVFESVLAAVLNKKPQCVEVLAPWCDLDGERAHAQFWDLSRRRRNVRAALTAAIEQDCALSVEALMKVPGLPLEKMFGTENSPLLNAVMHTSLKATRVLVRHELPSTGIAGTALLLLMRLGHPPEQTLPMINALLPGCDVFAVHKESGGIERMAINIALVKKAYQEADAIGLHMPLDAVQQAVRRVGREISVLPHNQARQERERLAQFLAEAETTGAKKERSIENSEASSQKPGDEPKKSQQSNASAHQEEQSPYPPLSARKGLRL